ncbi:MAG: hypothetical protein VX874_07450 [Pseudomonadota bacterium]|nr:hypothetical protein [Pseudomonadota bacterium]
MRYLQILFLFIFCGAANAAVDPDGIRERLNARDFKGVEAVLADAHQSALGSQDFSDLRAVYLALFQTGNTERLQVLKAWFEEFPATPYASTALAWAHYQRAYFMRGESESRLTSKEAFNAFRAELERAHSYTRSALEASQDFMPALDAAIVLERTYIENPDLREKVDGFLESLPLNDDAKSILSSVATSLLDDKAASIVDLVERSLQVAPDRHTLLVAMSALDPKWGGSSVRDGIALCVELSDQVTGYDPELCMIELVWAYDLDGDLHDMAVDALANREEEFLDYARLDTYLREWRTKPEAENEVMRILDSALEPGMLVRTYLNDLKGAISVFGMPFYGVDAQDALYRYIEGRLIDDPENPGYLSALIDEELRKVRADVPGAGLARAEELWLDMLSLATYDWIAWNKGAAIERERASSYDFKKLSTIIQSQLYYSNHAPWGLHTYLNELFDTLQSTEDHLDGWRSRGVDPGELNEQVECELYRVARLREHFLRKPWFSDLGTPGGVGSENPERAARMMKSATRCDWHRTAPIEELRYTAASPNEFLRKVKQ